jgi:hypothetical protein
VVNGEARRVRCLPTHRFPCLADAADRDGHMDRHAEDV